MRSCTGRGSTANSLAQNLGGHLLKAYGAARRSGLPAVVDGADLAAFRRARRELDAAEAPARQRRSYVRNLDGHLARLVARLRELYARQRCVNSSTPPPAVARVAAHAMAR